MAASRKYAHLLRHLVVFETACRTKNFSRAGEELGISRVAVSRQIAQLEAYLDTRLFTRAHRSVHPTRAGAELASFVEPALASITEGLEKIRHPKSARRLKVTTTAAFATLWLMPRLVGFSAEHPDIEIDLAVSDRYLDLDADEIDIAIRYGPHAPTGAVPLAREMIVPVWSPSYEPRTPLTRPQDLLSERLLQLSGRYRPEARWDHWFATRGLDFPGARLSTQVDSYITMLHAALEGQGIALAGNPLIDTHLAEGRLLTMQGAEPLARDIYWLVIGNARHAGAAAFASWIAAFFSAENPLAPASVHAESQPA